MIKSWDSEISPHYPENIYTVRWAIVPEEPRSPILPRVSPMCPVTDKTQIFMTRHLRFARQVRIGPRKFIVLHSPSWGNFREHVSRWTFAQDDSRTAKPEHVYKHSCPFLPERSICSLAPDVSWSWRTWFAFDVYTHRRHGCTKCETFSKSNKTLRMKTTKMVLYFQSLPSTSQSSDFSCISTKVNSYTATQQNVRFQLTAVLP